MARLYSVNDLRRCALISAIVGTILVIVNLGPEAYLRASIQLTLMGRIAMNYAVPFIVATVSAILANRARAAVPSIDRSAGPKA